jgi:dynactin complex subunit
MTKRVEMPDEDEVGHYCVRGSELTAEVERLQARLDSLMEAHFAQPDPRRLELEAEVEKLRADLAFLSQRHELDTIEVERLRAVLEQIANLPDEGEGGNDIARDALEEKA